MKILIADDEKLVRKSLHTLLLRADISDQNILEAATGSQMVEIISQQHIDIAFVDVKMPSQTGLEAIEQILDISPETVFFIISGFSDFSYAQKAISIGVSDYFLKPIDQATVQGALDKALVLNEKKRIMHTLQLERYVKKLIHKETNDFLQYFLPVIIIDPTAKHSEEYLRELLEKELGECNVNLLSTDADPHMVLLFSKSHEELTHCIAVIKQTFISQICIFCGNICNSSTLVSAIRNCKNFFEASFLRKPNLVNCINELSVNADEVPEEICVLFGQLFKAFSQRDSSKLQSLYPQFIALLHPIWSQLDVGGLRHGLQFYFGNDFSDIATIQDLPKCFMALVGKPASNESGNVVQCVLEDMEINFAHDLSINSYAEQYNITPNYLSAKFSAQVKVSFVKHLTSIRIENAKKLLSSTSLSISQISEICGYYSTSYFIKSFYKRENITPSEYRHMRKKIAHTLKQV